MLSSLCKGTLFNGSTAPSRPGSPHSRGSTITLTHQTRYDSSGQVISPTQRPQPDNTQHSQETLISSVGFESAVSNKQATTTHALDRASTGIGNNNIRSDKTKNGCLIDNSNSSPGKQNYTLKTILIHQLKTVNTYTHK
jgi:hypothetical protein